MNAVIQKRRMRGGVRVFEPEEVRRLTREYMQERFGWVSDTQSAVYVQRYAQVLEVMDYLRERQEMAVRAGQLRIRIERKK